MEFTIASSLKEQLIESVIGIIRSQGLLQGLERNWSAEGGFELPWTEEWLVRDFRNKDIALKYHNARQLRFIDDGNVITGLRFKDECNYWSNEELSTLYEKIQNFIYLPY